MPGGCSSGRHRGRRSGQGNGRGRIPVIQQPSSLSFSNVTFTEVRSRRQGSRKRVATSPVAAQIELPQRQQSVQLRTVLLPDGTARKRRFLGRSPERHSTSTFMTIPESQLMESEAQEEPDVKLEVQHELESLAEPESLVDNPIPGPFGIYNSGDAGEEETILAEPRIKLEPNHELESLTEPEDLVNNRTPVSSSISGVHNAGEEETILAEPQIKLEANHELESLAEPEDLVNNRTPVSSGISGGGNAGEEETILAEPQIKLEANHELASLAEPLVNDPTPGPSEISGGGDAGEEETILNTVDPLGILRIREVTHVSKRTSIGVVDDDDDWTIEEWLRDINSQDSEDEDLNDDRETELDDPLFVTDRLQPADDDSLTHIRRDEEANDRQVRELAPSHDYFDFAWSNDLKTFTGKREVFTGTPGPTFPVTHTMRPTDVFYRMFDHDFIEILVTETNRYAEQKLMKHRQDVPAKKRARIFNWKPTDRNEMVTFLAVIILQGLYPKVNEKSYFRYPVARTTYFGYIMTYDRYRLLKSLYHFVDNDNLTDRTKLNKIRPVIEYFNKKFSTLYKPRQDICIEESLLKWSDKLSLRIETYELCESFNGYLWKFFVYTDRNRTDKTALAKTSKARKPHKVRNEQDKRNEQDRHNSNKPVNTEGSDRQAHSQLYEFSTTAKIAYHLVQPLLHQGYTLITNNFYNSPLLARSLKRDGRTNVFGALSLNQEFVPDSLKTLSRNKLRCGEIVASCTTDLTLMVWKDSNLVSMISTYHPVQIGSVERYDWTKYKPDIVLDYKKSMRGINRKYKLLAAQPFEIQESRAWYKKLFLRLCNAALLNCFLIYTYNTTRSISHRQFRTVLAKDLLKIHAKVDLAKELRLLPTNRRNVRRRRSNRRAKY